MRAILTANCVPKNPFRTKLLAVGLPVINTHEEDILDQKSMNTAYENDQLRARISELEDLVKAYELREGSFKAKLADVSKTFSDIPAQVFNNCTVTINIVRKD